ncbi:MAG TPA: hypothetical protein VL241_12575 [Gemmatimonadales bacterium]|nr:hypothetical protein [Gemmatimonadales bacterium]
MPQRPVAWMALFVAGYASSLLLIHAGHSVGYQHYLPLATLLRSGPRLPQLVLSLQVVAVAWGLLRSRAALARALRVAGGRALWGVAAVLLLGSATLSRSPLTYAGELLLAGFIQLVQLGNVVLVCIALPGRWLAAVGRGADRLLGPPGASEPAPGGPDRFAWGLAAGVTAIALALAWLSYQRHPHIPDEVVYLYHARYFAAGRLAMPLPPVPEAFNVDLMSYQATRWFSPVPPGWPAVLAVGAWLGAPWLINPLLGGVNLLLAYVLLRELYPRRTARVAVLLLAASPWALFMAMNFMSHTATLTGALVAAVAVGRLRRDPRLRWAALGGLGIALVGLIRPLDGFTVALLLGLWSLGARGVRLRLLPAAALTLATLLASSSVLPYNRALTGSARTFPIMQYTDAMYGVGSNAMGFGANRGLGWPGVDPFPGHGPIDVLVNANFNLFQTNVELLGWATGSLLLLALYLATGRLRRADWQMLTVLGLVIGLHSFYWFSGGPDFGARYWYLILLPCLALSAQGLTLLERKADAQASGAGARVLAGAGLLIAGALLVFVPWRAIDKYYHYRGMRPDVRRLAAHGRFGEAIVLIRGRRFPDYASAATYNPIDPAAPQTLFAWDRGPDTRRALARRFAGRPFWILDGPTVTRAGFQVVAGPLTGEQLLARGDSLPPAP